MTTSDRKKIGPYELVGLLGRGGMGTVYRAVHSLTGQHVALKTVHLPEAGQLQSIRQEIHALSRIRYPGIVQILEQGQFNGSPWYSMELLEGVTLRRYSTTLSEQVDTLAEGAKPSMATAGLTEETSSFSNGPDWWTVQSESVATDPPDLEFQPGEPVQATVHDSKPGLFFPERSDTRYIHKILSFIRTLCVPLFYLHGEGIVHRDLKPENILVRPDGTPVIVDFGLVTRFSDNISRESLMSVGKIVGTVRYIAPEQLRGELVDARADIYSLGCILYELLSGRPPFSGEPLEVIQAHLSQPIIPLRDVVSGIDAGLDELVSHMLEKNPFKRIGYVDAIAALLEEFGAKNMFAEVPSPARCYLYRPGFVGRTQQLRDVMGTLEQLGKGRGGLFFVGGESGVGKTRFCLEIARQAALRQHIVLTGECPERGSLPLEGLRKPLQIIGDHCREEGPREIERVLGNRGKVLSQYEGSLAELEGLKTLPDPKELPVQEDRERLFNYLTETLVLMAQVRPLVLILDDVQWADELLLGFLSSLVGNRVLAHHDVMVLANYRSEELQSELQQIIARHTTDPIILERFETIAVQSMVKNMLALETVPDTFGDYLTANTEGNAFFVAEYLRTAVDEGLLSRDRLGNWVFAGATQHVFKRGGNYQLTLPHSIQDLVQRRISGLPETARALVNSAATYGRPGDYNLLRLMLEQYDDHEFMSAVEECRRRQILELKLDNRVRFSHDKIRECAYGSMSDDERSLIHAKAAQALEEVHGKEQRQLYPELGMHWLRSGDQDKARHYLLEAGLDFSKMHRCELAIPLYQQYLTITPEISENTILARQELARAFHDQGKSEAGISLLQETFELMKKLPGRELELNSYRVLGIISTDTGAMGKAIEYLQYALALAHHLKDYRRVGIMLCLLHNVHMRMGNFTRAVKASQQSLSYLRMVGDKETEAIVLGNIAIMEKEQNRVDNARQLYEQALELHRQMNDRRSEAFTLLNLANLVSYSDDKQQGIQLVSQAIALFREIGLMRNVAIGMTNLADMVRETGNLASASELYDQVLEIIQGMRDPLLEGHIYCNIGLLNRDQGKLDLADNSYKRALELLRKAGSRRSEGIVLKYQGELARLQGEYGKAEPLLTQAKLILIQVNDLNSVALCICEEGFLAIASGQSGQKQRDELAQLEKKIDLANSVDLAKTIAKFEKAFHYSRQQLHGRLIAGEPIESMPAILLNSLRP